MCCVEVQFISEVVVELPNVLLIEEHHGDRCKENGEQDIDEGVFLGNLELKLAIIGRGSLVCEGSEHGGDDEGGKVDPEAE